jgi:ankyrin repeat protein
MNIATTIYTLFLCSFSLIHCMEVTQNNNVKKNDLKKMVRSVHYSSSDVLNFIEKRAQHNNIELSHDNIKFLCMLDEEKINKIFLRNIKDDNIRDLALFMKADINTLTKTGQNCLWRITSPELLTHLINQGADVNAFDNNKDTPLSSLRWAPGFNKPTPKEQLESARILLTYGADPNLHNSALLLHDIITLNYTDPELSLEAAQLFYDHKININTQSRLGYTFLMEAILKKDIRLVKYLLEHGANPNLPTNNQTYPLHMAIEIGRQYCIHAPAEIIPEIVRFLLEHKANPNQKYPLYDILPLDVARLRAASATTTLSQTYMASAAITILQTYNAKEFKNT